MPLEQAKRTILRHHNISILASPHFNGDVFLSALGLFYSLKKLGKNVNLVRKEYPAKYDFLVNKNSSPQRADFLIAIKEEGVKVNSISYQKTSAGLNLFLTAKSGRLEPENIQLKPLKSEPGLLITIGLHSFAAASQLLDSEPKEVVNIDNSEENENFGEVNLVQTNVLSLAEIVFDLINALDEKALDAKAASALLAGLIEATDGLHGAGLNGKTFLRIRQLTLKADKAGQIVKSFANIRDKNGLSLFLYSIQKAMALREKSLITISLGREDFQRAEAGPADLRFTLRKAASGFFPFENFLCLFEQNNSPLTIFGVFYSKDERRLSGLKAHLSGQQKGSALFFKSGFGNLKEAHDKILAVL